MIKSSRLARALVLIVTEYLTTVHRRRRLEYLSREYQNEG